jgi:hypothetical protein
MPQTTTATRGGEPVLAACRVLAPFLPERRDELACSVGTRQECPDVLTARMVDRQKRRRRHGLALCQRSERNKNHQRGGLFRVNLRNGMEQASNAPASNPGKVIETQTSASEHLTIPPSILVPPLGLVAWRGPVPPTGSAIPLSCLQQIHWRACNPVGLDFATFILEGTAHGL